MKGYIKASLMVSIVILAALKVHNLPSPSTHAAGPWYVAPGGNDSDSCSSPAAPCATINGAIGKATSGDTILVATGVYTGSGDQVVLLDRNATLSGGWDTGFATQSGVSTIDGQGARRGMMVNEGITAVVERFAVQNGYAWGYYGSGNGAGIRNGGTLTLNNCTISGNTSKDNGGGIANYGAITLNNSVVSSNTASEGGGILNAGVPGATMTLNNSTVSSNTAWQGGGILNSYAVLTLNNSTISANGATTNGGGIYSYGVVALNNSTVSANTATYSGGGIRTTEGTVTLRNSLLGGNTAGNAPDCSGTIGSAGYNLVASTSGCTFSASTGDLTNVNARLGLLIGSPGYVPLLSGSPVINAGNPAGCTGSTGPLTTDQRGAARVGRCDIGAYEYTAPGPAAGIYASGGTPQTIPPSSVFRTPLRAAVLDSIGSPVSSATVTYSAPGSGASGTFADSTLSRRPL